VLSAKRVEELLEAAVELRRRASETMLVALALAASARRKPGPKLERPGDPSLLGQKFVCQWVSNGAPCGERARYRISAGRYCRDHTNAFFRGERSAA
jgi:hypothetical protein